MTQNIIFSFSQNPEYPVVNLDNNLQISILFGNYGDQIGRLSIEEQPLKEAIKLPSGAT